MESPGWISRKLEMIQRNESVIVDFASVMSRMDSVLSIGVTLRYPSDSLSSTGDNSSTISELMKLPQE
jgi:hypothetical protein